MNDLIQLEMSLEEARETDRLIKRHINHTRYLLLDMRDRKGWKALGYESFVEYGKKSLGYDKSHIYELADAGEIGLQIGFSAIAENQPKESHLRPLKAVPEAERKAIWEEATRKAEEESAKMTAKRVEDAVREWKQRSQESQHESNERRLKIRELETQIDLLKGQPAPADYETVKAEAAKLRQQLADIEARKDQLVQQQVIAKLKEREQDIEALAHRAEQLKGTIAEYQAHIAKVHLPELEMQQQIKAVEAFMQACAGLAAALALFEHAPNPATTSIWQKGIAAATDAAQAMRLHVDRRPELTLIHGDAA